MAFYGPACGQLTRLKGTTKMQKMTTLFHYITSIHFYVLFYAILHLYITFSEILIYVILCDILCSRLKSVITSLFDVAGNVEAASNLISGETIPKDYLVKCFLTPNVEANT